VLDTDKKSMKLIIKEILKAIKVSDELDD